MIIICLIDTHSDTCTYYLPTECGIMMLIFKFSLNYIVNFNIFLVLCYVCLFGLSTLWRSEAIILFCLS